MLNIIVPFVKQIAGYFIFQTEVLNEIALWHRFRLATDEKIVDHTIILTLSKQTILLCTRLTK